MACSSMRAPCMCAHVHPADPCMLTRATAQLVSHAAAFWLAAGLMVGFNALFARLLKDE